MKSKNKIKALLLMILLAPAASFAQPSAAWVFRYNGQGDYSDRLTCITADASGNIYTAGSSVNIGTDRDFLVQKMDASGNVVWRKMYNDVGNGPDEVTAIAVDASQNVYVTGFGKSQDAGNDYLTMKYDASGNISWIVTYNYSVANAYDQPNSIALDQDNNVIVTGQSDSDPSSITNDDYLTVKYSNAGDLLWTQRYNGVGDGIDRAVKVVTDNSNNIYITGRSYNGNDDDYVTIKYNSGGTQQWLKFGDRTHTDRATTMTIDGNANTYVTGWSSNGTNDDFYTIKYNSAGVAQWSKVYDFVDQDRAFAIAVDANGNVYVTGQSDGDAGPFTNLNFRTLKYNAAGVQQWSASFDGSAGNDDIPTGITVSSGEVFVTGYSDADATPVVLNNMVTIKYSVTGTASWTNTYNGNGGFDDAGNAIVADASGNIFVAGYEEDAQQQRNALLIKYSNAGSQLFANSFNGIGDNSDNIRDLKTDASGNIYITGYAVRRGQNRDLYILKLAPSGDTTWTRYVNGSSPDSEDEGQSVSIDGGNNIIVAGFTKNSGTSGDYSTVKYTPDGDSLWMRYYDSPTHENDKVYDMQQSISGNIYLTGRTDSDPAITSNDDATTVKYDALGNLAWTNSFDGAAHGPDRGKFIRIAASGNVYVAGRTFNGNNDDLLLIKYNDAGIQQWVKTYDGGFGNEDVNGIAMDESEDIYLTGISAGATDSSDLITAKYAPNGDQLWLKRYNGSGNGGDFGQALSLDPSGNVVVTGYSDGDVSVAVNFDIVTIKYDATGNELWKTIRNGSTNLDDIADALTTDQFGNVFVAGHSNNGTSTDINYDFMIIRYSSNGIEDWTTTYNNASSDTLDVPNMLWLVNNDLFVAGSSWQNGNQRDMIVIKYGEVTGINDQPVSSQTLSVYPNPFLNDITISGDELQQQPFDFELFDITGKKILAENITAPGTVTFHHALAAGMYTYRIIQHGALIQSGKLIHQQ